MIVPDSQRARLLMRKDDGSTAVLPFVEDWDVWWHLWGPRIRKEEGQQPWILFLLDAHEKLTEVNAIMARLMLGKPSQVGISVWSQKEWMNVQETAEEAKAWFERIVPTLDAVPEFAEFLLTAMYANFGIMARLARDLRGLQEEHGIGSYIVEKNEVDGSVRVVA